MTALYQGKVTHQRVRPKRHAFSYRVFWLLLDLDELEAVNQASRWFSIDRWNLISFHRSDHGPDDGSSLKAWISEIAAEAGLQVGRVRLLSFPRMYGYAFNPLSLWFCDDEDGQLQAVLYEVRNTFGEKHSYFMPVESEGPTIHEWDKKLFVSPFIDIDAYYRFRLVAPAETLRVTVKESDRQGHLFSATMDGVRAPLSTRSILRLVASHPLMTVKVITAIHWQALALWRKGAPYRSRPTPPANPVSTPGAHL